MPMIEPDEQALPPSPLADWLVAAAVIAFGAFVIWEGSSYPIGTARSMGPGYVPVALGVLLVLVGLGLAFSRDGHDDGGEPFALRPFIFISLGMLGFGLTLERFGLVPATVILIALSSLSSRSTRPLAVVGLIVALCTIGAVIFVYGLNLPIRLWRW
jgi:hypothetical protein